MLLIISQKMMRMIIPYFWNILISLPKQAYIKVNTKFSVFNKENRNLKKFQLSLVERYNFYPQKKGDHLDW